MPLPSTALVVGSGVSGLQAARALRRRGVAVLVLEQHDEARLGAWRSELRPDVPHHLFEFPEFPWPAELKQELPDGQPPSNTALQDYVRAYCSRFRLLELIRFGCQLLRLQPADAQGCRGGGGGGGGWRAVYLERHSGRLQAVSCDFVVLATGPCLTPCVPAFPGTQRFRGLQLHAGDAAAAAGGRQLAGRRVLVVGPGRSAVEGAGLMAVRRHAASVTRLLQQAQQPLPQRLAGGLSVRRLVHSSLPRALLPPFYTAGPAQRALHRAAAPLKAAAWRWLQRGAERHGAPAASEQPAHPWAALGGRRRPGGSQASCWRCDLQTKLLLQGQQSCVEWSAASPDGGVPVLTVHGDVQCFEPEGVRLRGGGVVCCDAVVFATGFAKFFGFLDSVLQARLGLQSDGLPLYRGVLPPALPGLAFVGGEAASFNPLLTSGLQAQWLAAALAGDVPLPPPEAMREDVQRATAWRRRTFPPHRGRASAVHLYMPHYHAQLMQDLGLRAPAPAWPLRLLTARDYAAAFALPPHAAANAPRAASAAAAAAGGGPCAEGRSFAAVPLTPEAAAADSLAAWEPPRQLERQQSAPPHSPEAGGGPAPGAQRRRSAPAATGAAAQPLADALAENAVRWRSSRASSAEAVQKWLDLLPDEGEEGAGFGPCERGAELGGQEQQRRQQQQQQQFCHHEVECPTTRSGASSLATAPAEPAAQLSLAAASGRRLSEPGPRGRPGDAGQLCNARESWPQHGKDKPPPPPRSGSTKPAAASAFSQEGPPPQLPVGAGHALAGMAGGKAATAARGAAGSGGASRSSELGGGVSVATPSCAARPPRVLWHGSSASASRTTGSSTASRPSAYSHGLVQAAPGTTAAASAARPAVSGGRPWRPPALVALGRGSASAASLGSSEAAPAAAKVPPCRLRLQSCGSTCGRGASAPPAAAAPGVQGQRRVGADGAGSAPDAGLRAPAAAAAAPEAPAPPSSDRHAPSLLGGLPRRLSLPGSMVGLQPAAVCGRLRSWTLGSIVPPLTPPQCDAGPEAAAERAEQQQRRRQRQEELPGPAGAYEFAGARGRPRRHHGDGHPLAPLRAVVRQMQEECLAADERQRQARLAADLASAQRAALAAAAPAAAASSGLAARRRRASSKAPAGGAGGGLALWQPPESRNAALGQLRLLKRRPEALGELVASLRAWQEGPQAAAAARLASRACGWGPAPQAC